MPVLISPFCKPSLFPLFCIHGFGEPRQATMVPDPLELQHASMPVLFPQYPSVHCLLPRLLSSSQTWPQCPHIPSLVYCISPNPNFLPFWVTPNLPPSHFHSNRIVAVPQYHPDWPMTYRMSVLTPLDLYLIIIIILPWYCVLLWKLPAL